MASVAISEEKQDEQTGKNLEDSARDNLVHPAEAVRHVDVTLNPVEEEDSLGSSHDSDLSIELTELMERDRKSGSYQLATRAARS